jgi:hypothetical protein
MAPRLALCAVALLAGFEGVHMRAGNAEPACRATAHEHSSPQRNLAMRLRGGKPGKSRGGDSQLSSCSSEEESLVSSFSLGEDCRKFALANVGGVEGARAEPLFRGGSSCSRASSLDRSDSVQFNTEGASEKAKKEVSPPPPSPAPSVAKGHLLALPETV